jgi:hypothetical protein
MPIYAAYRMLEEKKLSYSVISCMVLCGTEIFTGVYTLSGLPSSIDI